MAGFKKALLQLAEPNELNEAVLPPAADIKPQKSSNFGFRCWPISRRKRWEESSNIGLVCVCLHADAADINYPPSCPETTSEGARNAAELSSIKTTIKSIPASLLQRSLFCSMDCALDGKSLSRQFCRATRPSTKPNAADCDKRLFRCPAVT